MATSKLQDYLERSGRTAADLAAECGVAGSTITRLAKGEVEGSAEIMRRIYSASGGEVQPNDIAGIPLKPAPRVPPSPNSMAARAKMADHIGYRGGSPLSYAGSDFASDRCGILLDGAASILSMLGAAAEDASSLIGKGMSSEFDNRTGKILAGALEGVESLIQLASFLLED